MSSPRLFSLFLLAVIAWCSPVAGQDNFRTEMRQSIDTAVEKVSQNYEKFLAESEAPIEKARYELTQLNAKLNAAKMPKEATEVQNALNGLDQAVMKAAVPMVIQPWKKPQAAKPEPVPVPPQKPLLEKLVGKWVLTKSPDIAVFDRDGTGQLINTVTGAKWNSGQLRFLPGEVAEITWSNGFVWQMRLAGDRFVAVCDKDPAGQVASDGCVLIRQ
jgi:hypothetical protein